MHGAMMSADQRATRQNFEMQPLHHSSMRCFCLHPQEHVTCPTDMLVVPESTEQLASAIKDVRAKAQQQGKPLRMRPARRGFATMSSFACAPQPTLVNPFTVDGKQPLVVGWVHCCRQLHHIFLRLPL